MPINKKLLLGAVICSSLLAGCQTFNDVMDGAFGSGKKDSASAGTPIESIPTTPPPAQTTPPAQQTTTSSLVVYASSATPMQDYVLVERNNQRIYVDPRQTLLRSDLSDVIAVQDDQGRPYLSLSFNASGTQKLQHITSNNIGRSLAVTYKDSLISTISIDNTVQNGVLNVPMPSADEAISLEGRILDGD